MKFCPRCGKQLADHVRFCPGCGNAVPDVGKASTKHTGKPRKKTSAAIWVILALVFVLLIAGGVFWLLTTLGGEPDDRGDKKETTEATEEETVEIAARQFAFRQTAFECGTGETKTLVFAVFDPSVDTTGLTLYAQQGTEGEKIVLTDDGRGADTVAGDNVFYGMATFNPQEEGGYTYTLKTNADGFELKASRAKVTFYSEYSVYQERDLFYGIEYTLDQMACQFYMTDDPEESAENYLKIAGEMSDYLMSLEDAGDIETFEFNAPYFIIEFPVGTCVYEFSPGEDDMQTSTGTDSMGGYSETFLADADLPMLLLLPYDGDLNSAPFHNAMTAVSGADIGYSQADVRTGTQVNAAALRSMQNYRVIAINTHGGCDRDGAYFALGISSNDISTSDYANDRLIPSSSGRALATAAFFEFYYEDGALNDCLIYLGCCHGADNAILANTLIRKGADAVLAYTNSVYSGYDGDMIYSLFSALTVEENEAQTRSVVDALDDAKTANGDKDPTNTQWYYFWNRVREEDRAELKLFQADTSDPFRLVKDGDMGTVAGNVVAAADGSPISYARIFITGEDSCYAFYSGTDGSFAYSLPAGEYTITVTADGCCPLTFYTQVYVNYTTYLQTFLLVGEADGEGVATGTVTSAMTGEGLDGVALTLREGWNNTQGDAVLTAVTDAYGNYSVQLPVGNYTVCCEKEGYIANWFNIIVQQGTTENQNGSMNIDIDGDQFRIVLTWDENPRDIDIHIVGPKSNGGTFHTYYNYMTYREGDLVICSLDVDDRYSYGPETITLITLNPDEAYYCYLHNYAGTGTMASSGARVAVYCGAQLVANFSVPANAGSEDYWNVFAIVDGRIVLKNTITSSPDTDYAD